jgi:tellurite resistance protein
VLRHVAKHSPELAQAVVDAGALEALVLCLEEFDPSVKEAAAWALGYIASHTAGLAQAVVDAGTLPLLVLCLQEPELSLKRITASALNDVAKHSPELAQAVVDAGAVSYLAPLVSHEDSKLKRQVCSALAQVAKHSVDMAEVVVEAEVFPRMLGCLKDVDVYVRKNAATCVREVVKHTPELAKLVVNAGGAGALVDFVRETAGNLRLPGIMALGYIAAFSETMVRACVGGGLGRARSPPPRGLATPRPLFSNLATLPAPPPSLFPACPVRPGAGHYCAQGRGRGEGRLDRGEG